MSSYNFQHYPQFFTATIQEWKHLLRPDEYKQIIIDSQPWNIVNHLQEYKYSSASFYEEGIDIFGLVRHYDE